MQVIKKVSAFGVGVALSALLIKLVNVNKSRLDKREQDEKGKAQQEINKLQVQRIKDLQDILIRKKKYFEIQYDSENPEVLSKQCLIDFIKNSGELISPEEFAAIYQQNRKARRSVFCQIQDKYQVYFKFVCTLDENIKYLIEKSQKDFAIFLDIDFNKIVESIEYHIQNQDNHQLSTFRDTLIELTTQLREQLSFTLPLYSKPIDKNQLLKILDFEVQLFQKNSPQILNLVQKIGLQTKDEEESIPLFLNFYIADSIYLKFQVEIQQMTLDNSELTAQYRGKYDDIHNLKDNLIQQMHQIIQNALMVYEQDDNDQQIKEPYQIYDQ